MSTLTDTQALIDGRRIAHAMLGEGDPVILIHGTPSSSYIWRNVAPTITASGYKVHVFDLFGYGASERPFDEGADTSVSGQIPILLGLFDEWGLERAHIVAHDIGGAVAQRFCVFHPDKAKSLTLIDTVSFDSWPSKRTHQQMQAGLESLIKAPDADHRAHFREWLLSTVEDEDRFNSDALNVYLDLISGPVGQASLFQHQVAHYDPKHTAEIGDRLSEISSTMPVQILWGEKDAWQVVDWAHKLHDALPGSMLHILPECGHFAMEDQPERISELVVAFLDACPRS